MPSVASSMIEARFGGVTFRGSVFAMIVARVASVVTRRSSSACFAASALGRSAPAWIPAPGNGAGAVVSIGPSAWIDSSPPSSPCAGSRCFLAGPMTVRRTLPSLSTWGGLRAARGLRRPCSAGSGCRRRPRRSSAPSGMLSARPSSASSSSVAGRSRVDESSGAVRRRRSRGRRPPRSRPPRPRAGHARRCARARRSRAAASCAAREAGLFPSATW